MTEEYGSFDPMKYRTLDPGEEINCDTDLRLSTQGAGWIKPYKAMDSCFKKGVRVGRLVSTGERYIRPREEGKL